MLFHDETIQQTRNRRELPPSCYGNYEKFKSNIDLIKDRMVYPWDQEQDKAICSLRFDSTFYWRFWPEQLGKEKEYHASRL